MRHVFGAMVDARLQGQGFDLLRDIEAIKEDYATRGFLELPGPAIGQICDLCSAAMDKTMEAALGVFGELRDKLQVTEVAELKKDLITDLDLRLKSISADALSYVKYGKASEVQRFQLKQSFVLAAACSAVDA